MALSKEIKVPATEGIKNTLKNAYDEEIRKKNFLSKTVIRRCESAFSSIKTQIFVL